jgi:hypothetical protein
VINREPGETAFEPMASPRVAHDGGDLSGAVQDNSAASIITSSADPTSSCRIIDEMSSAAGAVAAWFALLLSGVLDQAHGARRELGL